MEPNAASAVVLRSDGRVLLVQRARPPREGTWNLPGGRLEPGETSAEAAAREVREETGLDVIVGRLLGEVGVGAFRIAVHAATLAPDCQDDARLDAAVAADDACAILWATDDDLVRLDVTEATRDAIERARAGGA